MVHQLRCWQPAHCRSSERIVSPAHCWNLAASSAMYRIVVLLRTEMEVRSVSRRPSDAQGLDNGMQRFRESCDGAPRAEVAGRLLVRPQPVLSRRACAREQRQAQPVFAASMPVQPDTQLLCRFEKRKQREKHLTAMTDAAAGETSTSTGNSLRSTRRGRPSRLAVVRTRPPGQRRRRSRRVQLSQISRTAFLSAPT